VSEVIRLSLDTEFNERAEKNSFLDILMSIGFVDIDDGTDLGHYAVHGDYNDKAPMDDFVRDIVVPRLFIDSSSEASARTKYTTDGLLSITKGYFRRRVEGQPDATKVEFWAKNGSYDNVLLCRLFGGMMNLYSFMNDIGIEKTNFRDLNELKFPPREMATPKPKAGENKLHNSFYDACHQAEIIRWVEANRTPVCTEAASMGAAIKNGLIHN